MVSFSRCEAENAVVSPLFPVLLLNFDPPGGDIYCGKPRTDGKKPVVTVNGKRLPPRFDLARIAPTGFAWGYGGAGPGQLALAILAHAAGEETALEEWDRFREEVIKQLEMEQPFALTAADVAAFLAGRRLDAARFIRPVRQKAPPGFWQRLLDKSA